ncbi:MAG TPA: histone deacetylase [Casimicrobiaceae bacterium]|nr:histone deacetylase [Casimicrobiaceae bacterium]
MPTQRTESANPPPRLRSIPVCYAPEQVAEPQISSPSASKPGQVVARWQASGHPIDVRRTTPVTVDDLARAHDRAYVEDVLALHRNNGFGNCSASVARSLPWTSGSMLSAARHALKSGRVACAPCSGFHHAGWDHPRGFCTFNGLMVTALALQAEGKVTRIGILDCDQHYGDGTQEIIDRLDAHGWIRHVTAGNGYVMHAGRFLAALPAIVESFADCDLVLYQAGADPHVDDPLGGFLDDEQLAQRDAIVFTSATKMRLPVAWNLAGGYQEPLSKVLDIHDRTMAACVAAYC